MQTRIDISDAVLQWVVRKTQFAALPPKAAAHLTKWVSGEKKPTFNQLEEVSKATGIPLGYFFLQQPPHEDVPLMEYRTVNSVSFSQPSRNLIATIHEMEMVQDWTREYMIAEGITPPACVGAFKSHDDAAVCAAKVREILGLSETGLKSIRMPLLLIVSCAMQSAMRACLLWRTGLWAIIRTSRSI